jgi:hypothetical protein
MVNVSVRIVFTRREGITATASPAAFDRIGDCLICPDYWGAYHYETEAPSTVVYKGPHFGSHGLAWLVKHGVDVKRVVTVQTTKTSTSVKFLGFKLKAKTLTIQKHLTRGNYPHFEEMELR